MVLDIETRDILGRTGTWGGPKGPAVPLPLLLSTRPASTVDDVGGVPDAVLSRGEAGPKGPLAVRDLGSALRPSEPGATWAHLEIPPEHPLPPSLADVLDDVPLTTLGGDGLVEVVHASSGLLGGWGPTPDTVQWVVLASAAHLASRPSALVDAVVAARERAGPGRLLYLPGVATPRNLALLAYMGADVVDDVQCHLEAARGRLVLPELGHVHMSTGAGPDELAAANLVTMRKEVDLVRGAIAHSALRELVEVRVRSEPWQVVALRRLDRRHRDILLRYCPVHRETPLVALSRESLDRVEVTSWVETLRERYSPPPSVSVLLLLPCSARKPYSTSRTHRRIAEALSGVPNPGSVHQVVLTSPLGAVPMELERTYPAAHYDIPVSGEWFSDEAERMRALVDHIRGTGSYDAVISHMGQGLEFLEADASVVRSREAGEGATDPEGLRRLAGLVSRAAREAPRVHPRQRAVEDMVSLARFQFGRETTDALMDGALVEGRPPGLKLKGPDGGQRASVVPSRGRLSLTLPGAEVVAATARHRVWMDEFDLRGDLFAVGVLDADPHLRPGEEAVVMRGDRVEAVGLARMCAEEMVAAKRGVAVAVRHRRGGGDEG